MGINKGSGVARATGEWSLKEIRLQWFSIDEGRALQGRLDGAFPVSGRVPMWFLGLKWQVATLEVKGTHQALTTYGCVALPCPTCSLLSTGDV
jgi:hypothetical protein